MGFGLKAAFWVGLLYAAYQAFKGIVDTATKGMGDLADGPVGEFFEGIAWQILVPPGPNQDVVDYWTAKGMTAEIVANGVKAHVVIPLYGEVTFERGYQLLQHCYMGTTVRDLDRANPGSPTWMPRDKDDLVWNEPWLVMAKEWASEQLWAYTEWGKAEGYL